MTLWSLCARTVRRRPIRSGLTILGLAVGIGAVVALLGLAGGLERSWQEVYRSRRVDLIVINSSDTDFLQSRVPEAALDGLRGLPEVQAADGGLVDLTSYEGVANTFISGRTPGGFLMEPLQILDGRGLSPIPDEPAAKRTAGHPASAEPAQGAGPAPDEPWRPPPPRHPAEREILLGSAFAAGHGKRVGDTVLVEDEPFRVVGIYRAGSLFENGGAVVHLKALQRFELREGELTSIEVRLHDPAQFERVAAWLRGQHPQLACQRPADMLEQSFGLEIVQAMAWVVSTLALAIGLMGTSNTMLMSVMEQRRQIGILRALGWRHPRILGLVLGETLVLSASAYVLGCALGWAATAALAQVEQTRNILQPRVDGSVLVQALLAALLLSFAAAAYPAYRAAKITPMEALRLP
jgi:putative ABC transport system permease protein